MTGNPFLLTFTLKQHTPIIHFQHDQLGATLRASEVKPKLDRFILTKIGGGDYHEGLKIAKSNNWLVGTGENKTALSYQVNVYNPSTPSFHYFDAQFQNATKTKLITDRFIEAKQLTVRVESPSSYFANADKVEIKKDKTETLYLKSMVIDEIRLGMMSSNLSMEVKSLFLGLLAEIELSMPAFFASENFGTRQSKGFGCFQVTQVNGKTVDESIEILLKSVFTIVYKKKNLENKSWYEAIHSDYKLLKSGRGASEKPHGYAKSLLFWYFAKQAKPIRWEKRWLKKEIRNRAQKGQPFYDWELKEDGAPIDVSGLREWKDTVTHEYAYVRALLGLAEHFEFLTQYPGSTDKFIATVGHDTIKRFRSPITFKFYNGVLYLCANQMSESHPILDEIFTFKLYQKGSKGKTNEQIPTNPPRVPSAFNLKEFLKFALVDPNNSAPKPNHYHQI